MVPSSNINNLRVLISCSHNSQEHMDRVLALSDHLRADGVDCIIDQYETSPPEGWARWCDDQIEKDDFILVVCTEIYERQFKGIEEFSHADQSHIPMILRYVTFYGSKRSSFILEKTCKIRKNLKTKPDSEKE